MNLSNNTDYVSQISAIVINDTFLTINESLQLHRLLATDD